MPEPALADSRPDAYAYANEDSYSPRSELLSTPPGGRHTQKHKHNRSKTKPSARYRKDRERHHAHEPHHELLRLLIDREYEAEKLRRALDEASRRIDNEAQRAAEAERV
ncbi:uncharacterized protein SCHCODRAFT_02624847, partial [Schizophyllum commune H4-8]|uniref:uncharacterized protein n=1 Tax=Schizophyllum commune (strain H4-8 / FGSC 9210) TaxID=578458 RepID=UPI00215E8465